MAVIDLAPRTRAKPQDRNLSPSARCAPLYRCPFLLISSQIYVFRLLVFPYLSLKGYMTFPLREKGIVPPSPLGGRRGKSQAKDHTCMDKIIVAMTQWAKSWCRMIPSYPLCLALGGEARKSTTTMSRRGKLGEASCLTHWLHLTD